jgi:hypothetical protein
MEPINVVVRRRGRANHDDITATVRITRISEKTVPIKSEIRNAVIDFGQMTASVVAIASNVWRDGKPLVGYGFNSNGAKLLAAGAGYADLVVAGH